MTRRRKVEYFRCGNCGYRHENTQDCYTHIWPGDYCPRCGEQATDYEMLHRDNLADVPRESRHFYERAQHASLRP